MSDPRLVQPQRVRTRTSADADGCATGPYWCAKRVTALVLAVLLVVALGAGTWWWVR